VIVAKHVVETLAPIVDDDVGAEPLHESDVGVAGRRSDRRAEVLRELNGERAHAARAGLDEDALAGAQSGVAHETLPRGLTDERKRCRLHVVDVHGFVRKLVRVDRDELRVSALARVRRRSEDLVAALEPRDQRSDLDDDTRDIEPEHHRHLVTNERAVKASPDLAIDRVDACGTDLDQDIARSDRRRGNVFDTEDIRPAVLADDGRSHATLAPKKSRSARAVASG
jgi:hypothetical protein